MKIDENLHEAYFSRAYYQPTPTPVYCRNCGTRLKTYYAESRLYAVRCGYCETITLVKANNPTEAARYVGEYEGEGKGEWIYHECVSSYDGTKSGYSCSVCSAFVDEDVFDTDEFHKKHCGNCGAIMKGGEDK